MANPTITPIMTPARGPDSPDAKPVYLVDLYGNPISGAEPNISIAIRNKQGFTYQMSGTFPTSRGGLSVFNPSNSGKNILIYSLIIYVNGATNASIGGLYLTTSDPALGTPVTPVNQYAGGPASVAVASSAVSGLSTAGTLLRPIAGQDDRAAEQLVSPILLPSGAANGVAAYLNPGSSVIVGLIFSGIEF